ncbi:class II fructose-bisphosphate aldolase [Ruminococcaceae bacterium OttesenSCG-928-D13]|nr:class II fructose-bisphosphate aldolase [Ruminococcaceae bacterium OttesenSCG-928-D13]
MDSILNLGTILAPARAGGFAVGSFSPRYTKMIRPVILAAMAADSPAIVQISQKELTRHGVDLEGFADEFFAACAELRPAVPLALHLDHTKDLEIIRRALACGFSSVMIDASEMNFEDNVAVTRQVVALAHAKAAGVEAELGRIGTTDFVETDTDEEQYTDPQQAKTFCELTGVDALAVSVGTAHGVYTVRQPKIDYDRLAAINALTPTPLVLHGGSGVPSEMVVRAACLPSGGVAKVNIATDLELAMLGALGLAGHRTDAQLEGLGPEALESARAAVQNLVADRMEHYLLSAGKAARYPAEAGA